MAKHSFKIYRSVIIDQIKDVEIEADDIDEAHDKMIDLLAEHAEDENGWVDDPETKDIVDYGTLDEVEALEDDEFSEAAVEPAPAPVEPAPAAPVAPVVTEPAPVAQTAPEAPKDPAPPKKSWW